MDKHTQKGVRQRGLELENARLLAENAKLREALLSIVGNEGDPMFTAPTAQQYKAARAALAP